MLDNMTEVLAHFISKADEFDDRRKAFLYWFTSTYPVTEFNSMDKLFVLYANYCVKLDSLFSEKTLKIFLKYELEKILHKDPIVVEGTETCDLRTPVGIAEAAHTISVLMVNLLSMLGETPVNIQEFKVDADAFRVSKLNERYEELLQQSYVRLQETADPDESLDNISSEAAAIKEIYSADRVKELDPNSTAMKQKARVVCTTGLPAIDTDMIALYTGQMIGIEAAPGVGKTRFTVGVWAYRAMTLYKQNVLYFAMEQSEEELEAMFVSLHAYNMFHIVVSDKMIRRDLVPEELKAKVAAARWDLLESGKYGKLAIKSEQLYVETFVNKIKYYDKLEGHFDLVVLDYIYLMRQKGGKYTKSKQHYEVVATAFRDFKQYVLHNDCAGIAINQYNTEGVKASKQDKAIDSTMSAGGQESGRSNDYTFGLVVTDQMKTQHKMRIESFKARLSEGNINIIATARLDICYFAQVNNSHV